MNMSPFVNRLALILLTTSLALWAAERPNILLIVVDDMGYSDLGCYGGEIPTPTLDGLAADGVRLARFYNGAQCCPSRASLLSGLYPHQAGMGDMNAQGPKNRFWAGIGSEAYLGFKNTGIAILPEVLHENGYQCFMSGKWHLGDEPDNWPSVRGFERTFSLIIGASEHFTGYFSWRDKGPIAPFIRDGQLLESLPENFYSTDTFTDEALRFIDEAHPDQPWFTYLAYTAPHWPIQAPEADIARHRATYLAEPAVLRQQRVARLQELGLIPAGMPLPPLEAAVTEEAIHNKESEMAEWMAIYAAMVDRVDQNIARIITRLEERQELDNTLILFLSDNGADTVRGPRWGQLSNTPFRASKVWVYDGGIATPLIAHWPAGIPASQNGRILPGYGHIIDLQPTCLSAAGVEAATSTAGQAVLPLEGMDLLPALRGDSELPPERPLFWERQGNEAVRRGPWKLVRAFNGGQASGSPDGNGERVGQWQLFHLASDPGETTDLLADHKTLAWELHELYRSWAARTGVIPREIINAR